MSEETDTVEDLVEHAEAYLHETSLTPEEYEALIVITATIFTEGVERGRLRGSPRRYGSPRL